MFFHANKYMKQTEVKYLSLDMYQDTEHDPSVVASFDPSLSCFAPPSIHLKLSDAFRPAMD